MIVEADDVDWEMESSLAVRLEMPADVGCVVNMLMDSKNTAYIVYRL